jgi:hypothetical protein
LLHVVFCGTPDAVKIDEGDEDELDDEDDGGAPAVIKRRGLKSSTAAPAASAGAAVLACTGHTIKEGAALIKCCSWLPHWPVRAQLVLLSCLWLSA